MASADFDPDWPLLNRQLETITKVLTTVQDRIERKTR
jgi:hypothetical protein